MPCILTNTVFLSYNTAYAHAYIQQVFLGTYAAFFKNKYAKTHVTN